MKEKVQFYDFYSLYRGANPKSGIEDIFIFDDFMSYDENFHLSSYLNYPIRLGMVAIIICKKGYGKLRVGLDDILITPNMVLIILPEQIFQCTEISPDLEAGYIFLNKEFFDIQNDYKIVLDLQSHFFKQPYVQLPEKDMEEAMIVFNIIKRKFEERTNLFLKEVIQTYIRILFYIACNVFLNSKEKGVKTRKEEIFETFVSMLEQNFRSKQNISWYAEQICLTPKYLSKLIFEVSGKHAGEWIKDYIILEASALLNSSSLTVQQISNELGFTNQSHFGSYFKRYTGVSPKEYKYAKNE
jgi:AraC-like DNA-binding protein